MCGYVRVCVCESVHVSVHACTYVCVCMNERVYKTSKQACVCVTPLSDFISVLNITEMRSSS